MSWAAFAILDGGPDRLTQIGNLQDNTERPGVARIVTPNPINSSTFA